MKKWVLHIRNEGGDHYFAVSDKKLSDEDTKKVIEKLLSYEVELYTDDGVDDWFQNCISGEWHESEVIEEVI